MRTLTLVGILASAPVFCRAQDRAAGRTTGLLAARSTEELHLATLAAMNRLRVVKAIVSGEFAEQCRKAQPGKIRASPVVARVGESVDSLRTSCRAGCYQALAEFASQYSGLPSNDLRLEPYFLAEELDVPLGIHVRLAAPCGLADAGREDRPAVCAPACAGERARPAPPSAPPIRRCMPCPFSVTGVPPDLGVNVVR